MRVPCQGRHPDKKGVPNTTAPILPPLRRRGTNSHPNAIERCGLCFWRRMLDPSASPSASRHLGTLTSLPQFVDPAEGHVALQFVVLGFEAVVLNTLADIVVAFAASRIREGAAARPALIRRLREASGATMIVLGLGLAFAKRPAT